MNGQTGKTDKTAVTGLAIVPLREEHLPAVAALERDAFAQPWSADALRAALDNPLSAFLVALRNGAVAGYLGLYCVVDEGQIANIAVAPACRRQGVATALLDRAAALGRARGLCRLTLEVRASNAAAVALYEGRGWQRDGVRPRFYERPVEDALLYSLNL